MFEEIERKKRLTNASAAAPAASAPTYKEKRFAHCCMEDCMATLQPSNQSAQWSKGMATQRKKS